MPQMKQAVITGATRGIGFAIAERLAKEHYTPFLNYAHDDTQAQKALAEIQQYMPQARLIKADVTKEAEVKRLLQEATRNGPVTLWVNNVGDFLFKSFLEISLVEWKSILKSNLTSAFLGCRAVIPHMRAQGGGCIINIGMMHADVLRAVPNTLPYTIAKSGLLILTKSLAESEGPYGIRVNAINPGFIRTTPSIQEEYTSKIPLSRYGSPADVASAVAFFASEDARYITGAILNVHGGAFL
jgi:NAD(P)-dependent dehydrogenase (short-subunit alcohol dehydrogenase family)